MAMTYIPTPSPNKRHYELSHMSRTSTSTYDYDYSYTDSYSSPNSAYRRPSVASAISSSNSNCAHVYYPPTGPPPHNLTLDREIIDREIPKPEIPPEEFRESVKRQLKQLKAERTCIGKLKKRCHNAKEKTKKLVSKKEDKKKEPEPVSGGHAGCHHGPQELKPKRTLRVLLLQLQMSVGRQCMRWGCL